MTTTSTATISRFFRSACALADYARAYKNAIGWINFHHENGTGTCISSYDMSKADAIKTLDSISDALSVACFMLDTVLDRERGETLDLFYEAVDTMEGVTYEDIPDHDASYTGLDLSLEKHFLKVVFGNAAKEGEKNV